MACIQTHPCTPGPYSVDHLPQMFKPVPDARTLSRGRFQANCCIPPVNLKHSFETRNYTLDTAGFTASHVRPGMYNKKRQLQYGAPFQFI